MADDPWASFSPQANQADQWAAFNPASTQTSQQPSPSALPQPFLDRIAQGEGMRTAYDQLVAKPYSQRIKEWAAKEYKGGDYPGAAVGTVSAFIAGMPEMVSSGIKLAKETFDGKVVSGPGLRKEDYTDDPNAEEPLGELIRRSQDMAMTGGVRESSAPLTSLEKTSPLISLGDGTVARPYSDADGAMRARVVGTLPKEEDFSNAAAAIKGNTSVIEKNLHDLWKEKGIHPSEASNDARSDAFLAHDLSSAATDTSLPKSVPPSEQPTTPAAKIMSAAKDSVDAATGLARNIQFMLDPMAAGSDAAMVVGKDTISEIRRIDWDAMRSDEQIMRTFSPERRTRMFNAMDEESVALQKGESREHQGLATLDPEERAAVEKMDTDQQAVWSQMNELGMIDGEGIPMHAARVIVNIARSSDKDAAMSLNTIGKNVRVKTGTMLHRKYLTVDETEAAAKAKFGTEATVARDIRVVPMAMAKQQRAVVYRRMINNIEEIGRSSGDATVREDMPNDPGWFTLDHPAFKTWRPRFDKDGQIVKDESGEPVFDQNKIYIRGDFEGPLRAIMDETPSKHPLARGAMTAYQAVMALKGKAMTVILNSPLIHNAVVWGKVAPSAPGEWLGFRLYWKGNAIKNDPVRAGQLIDRGLAPIGHRGSFQDISSAIEEPELQPGRSTTSKLLAFGPGLINEAAGTAIKRAIDTAGDVVHNKLLWDRVADVQFGVAAHLSDKLVDLGTDRIVADRIGAHFANTIVGSMPKEAMSGAARAFLNTLLFSRSFTVGNLQVGKMASVGIPKPIMAQIERDLGVVPQEAQGVLKTLNKRRAIGQVARTAVAIIGIDYAMSKIINSLIQNSLNVVVNDSTIDKEFRDYGRRLQDEYNKVQTNPSELLHPLNLVDRMTPMGANEKGKENRIFIGYDKDGTAIYGRNPMGKYPEELVDWPSQPIDTLKRKLSPLAGGILDILANDKGFKRPVYDPYAESYVDRSKAFVAAMGHLVERHFPLQQIQAAGDLFRGEGDKRVNMMRLWGPVAGFTVSQGAPGGMKKGEIYSERDSYKAKFDIAWPDIRKQIKNGDLEGARASMNELRVTPRDQRILVRSANNPSFVSGRMMRDFLYRATPEQRARMDQLRQQSGPLAPEQ